MIQSEATSSAVANQQQQQQQQQHAMASPSRRKGKTRGTQRDQYRHNSKSVRSSSATSLFALDGRIELPRSHPGVVCLEPDLPDYFITVKQEVVRSNSPTDVQHAFATPQARTRSSSPTPPPSLTASGVNTNTSPSSCTIVRPKQPIARKTPSFSKSVPGPSTSSEVSVQPEIALLDHITELISKIEESYDDERHDFDYFFRKDLGTLSMLIPQYPVIDSQEITCPQISLLENTGSQIPLLTDLLPTAEGPVEGQNLPIETSVKSGETFVGKATTNTPSDDSDVEIVGEYKKPVKLVVIDGEDDDETRNYLLDAGSLVDKSVEKQLYETIAMGIVDTESNKDDCIELADGIPNTSYLVPSQTCSRPTASTLATAATIIAVSSRSTAATSITTAATSITTAATSITTAAASVTTTAATISLSSSTTTAATATTAKPNKNTRDAATITDKSLKRERLKEKRRRHRMHREARSKHLHTKTRRCPETGELLTKPTRDSDSDSEGDFENFLSKESKTTKEIEKQKWVYESEISEISDFVVSESEPLVYDTDEDETLPRPKKKLKKSQSLDISRRSQLKQKFPPAAETIDFHRSLSVGSSETEKKLLADRGRHKHLKPGGTNELMLLKKRKIGPENTRRSTSETTENHFFDTVALTKANSNGSMSPNKSILLKKKKIRPEKRRTSTSETTENSPENGVVSTKGNNNDTVIQKLKKANQNDYKDARVLKTQSLINKEREDTPKTKCVSTKDVSVKRNHIIESTSANLINPTQEIDFRRTPSSSGKINTLTEKHKHTETIVKKSAVGFLKQINEGQTPSLSEKVNNLTEKRKKVETMVKKSRIGFLEQMKEGQKRLLKLKKQKSLKKRVVTP